MRPTFNLEDLARVIINAQPNPQNRPHTHIVGQARCIVDTHLGGVALNRRVTLREAIPNVRVASVGSYIIPNVLKTVVAGFNDVFYTVHTNTPAATPNFTIKHTMTPGNYDADTLSTHVASLIQTALRARDAAFNLYTVIGTTFLVEGHLNLTFSNIGGFGVGQTFGLFAGGDVNCRFEYFGLSAAALTTPWSITFPSPAATTATWSSQHMINMSRTSFLTVISDLGSRARIGPGVVRKTLLHVPFVGVAFGFPVSSQFDPGELAHKLSETTTIQSFEFDILDDSGRSVIAEFAGIPAIVELVFYQ